MIALGIWAWWRLTRCCRGTKRDPFSFWTGRQVPNRLTESIGFSTTLIDEQNVLTKGIGYLSSAEIVSRLPRVTVIVPNKEDHPLFRLDPKERLFHSSFDTKSGLSGRWSGVILNEMLTLCKGHASHIEAANRWTGRRSSPSILVNYCLFKKPTLCVYTMSWLSLAQGRCASQWSAFKSNF